MISPDIQTLSSKNTYLSEELNASYEAMVKEKLEIIKSGIKTSGNEEGTIFSIGMGFAIKQTEVFKENK